MTNTFNIENYESERTMSIADAPNFTELEWEQLDKGRRLFLVQKCFDTDHYRVLMVNPCTEIGKEIWILRPDELPGYRSAERAHQIAMMYKMMAEDFVIVRPLGVDSDNPKEWELNDQFAGAYFTV